MEKLKTTLGLVVNKKILREADILVTLLTPKDGKILTLAKNAANIKSSRLGSLQLGNTIKAQLYLKNDRIWLSETVTFKSFLQKDKSLTQLNLLFYFLEIINRLIAENQHIVGAFEIAGQVVDAINNNKVENYIENEINFIKIIGFGLPPDILNYFNKKDYKTTQSLIKRYFESIIEKPLESNKLFK